MNRSGSGSCTQPERDGGNSSRDQVAQRPRLLNRGEPTGRRRYDLDRETHPEASTSGSHHSNREENKPTLRKQGPSSRDLGSRKRKTKRFSILMLSEEWRLSPPVERRMAQKRRGTTGTMTVLMTRNGKEPAPSHNLQENSQARFF